AGVSMQVYNSSGAFVTSTSTAADGSWVVRGLTPGGYFVRTFNSLGYINLLHGSPTDIIFGPSRATSGPLVRRMGTAPTGGANLPLSQGGTIKGTIRSSAPGTPPIGGVSVSAVTPGTGASVASASTDASGNFAITGIVPGSYLLRTFNSQGFVDQVYNAPGP